MVSFEWQHQRSSLISHFSNEKVTGPINLRKEFWDRYWGRAGQLLVNFLPVPKTVPKVCAKVNSVQFSARRLANTVKR